MKVWRWRDPATGLFWFRYSPDEGDPTCLCSFCLKVIPEVDDYDPPDESGGSTVAIRIWQGEGKNMLEARFHEACLRIVLKRGLFVPPR